MEALELAREIGLYSFGIGPYCGPKDVDTPQSQKQLTAYLLEKSKRQKSFLEKFYSGAFNFNNGCDCSDAGGDFTLNKVTYKSCYGSSFMWIKSSRDFICPTCKLEWNIDPFVVIVNAGDTKFSASDRVKASNVIAENILAEQNGLKPADVVLAPNPFGG